MLSNFDLMWIHVKKLIEEMTASEENMLNETLYKNYCASFEQLMQIIAEEAAELNIEKLHDVHITLKELGESFANLQGRLQGQMNAERVKARAHAAYNHYTGVQRVGINSKS
jgi:hypothetical protein